MRTYIGVDYHRGFSYMTAMDETGQIRARGRVANDREAVKQFLKRADQGGYGAAVLEATRNWTLMYVTLASRRSRLPGLARLGLPGACGDAASSCPDWF